MKVCKALLLILIIALTSLGPTLTGCEQKSEPAPTEQAIKAVEETQEATEEAEATAEEAAAEHQTATEHPK